MIHSALQNKGYMQSIHDQFSGLLVFGLVFNAAIKIPIVFIMYRTSDDLLCDHQGQTAIAYGTVIDRIELTGKQFFWEQRIGKRLSADAHQVHVAVF